MAGNILPFRILVSSRVESTTIEFAGVYSGFELGNLEIFSWDLGAENMGLQSREE